jgi:hypothetical protein
MYIGLLSRENLGKRQKLMFFAPFFTHPHESFMPLFHSLEHFNRQFLAIKRVP